MKKVSVPQKMLLTGALIALMTTAQAAVDIYPSQITGSTVPGNLGDINYILVNGNWKPTIALPTSAPDKTKISISSSAVYASTLSLTNTNIPVPTMNISTGDSVSFIYSVGQGKWLYNTTIKTPVTVGSTVPVSSADKVVSYQMWNGNWTPVVKLPATAKDGQLVMVASYATYTAKIDPQNIVYASSFTLPTNGEYVFLFQAQLNRWVPVKTPINKYDLRTISSDLPALTNAPINQVYITGDTAYKPITLPAQANDRDKLAIISNSNWPSFIFNFNTQDTRSLKLLKGDRYEFIYLKDKQTWLLQSLPRRFYDARNTPTGVLPTQTSPIAEFYAENGNWVPTVTLPIVALPGDQVIVKSNASWTLSVKANRASFTSVPITTGDKVRFVLDNNFIWQRETNIITELLVYSDAAVAAIGETAEQARLYEGIRLTNEALENSNANFYFKPVGFMKHAAFGGDLLNVLHSMLFDFPIQNLRNQLKADGVYYEGTESGGYCGLANINTIDALLMNANGSTQCGTITMRHELGHNLGLNHCPGDVGLLPYGTGNNLTSDIMCGNVIPYYSSPKLYTQDYGVPLGIDGKIDAVRAMNEHSTTIANFR